MHATLQVTIAAQVYDYIDKHIQSLDEDLVALNAEMESGRTGLVRRTGALPPRQT